MFATSCFLKVFLTGISREHFAHYCGSFYMFLLGGHIRHINCISTGYPLQIASPSVINPKSYWEGSPSGMPEALTSSKDIRHEANFETRWVGFRKGSAEWKIHRWTGRYVDGVSLFFENQGVQLFSYVFSYIFFNHKCVLAHVAFCFLIWCKGGSGASGLFDAWITFGSNLSRHVCLV